MLVLQLKKTAGWMKASLGEKETGHERTEKVQSDLFFVSYEMQRRKGWVMNHKWLDQL